MARYVSDGGSRGERRRESLSERGRQGGRKMEVRGTVLEQSTSKEHGVNLPPTNLYPDYYTCATNHDHVNVLQSIRCGS